MATLKLKNSDLNFTVEHKYNYVAKTWNDSSFIIYGLDEKVHRNAYIRKFISPYYADNTLYHGSKIYKIFNKEYIIHVFITDNNSTINNFAYYSPEFGFICYNIARVKYQRIVNIEDAPASRKAIILKLADTVIGDSSVFARPNYSSEHTIKFKGF